MKSLQEALNDKWLISFLKVPSAAAINACWLLKMWSFLTFQIAQHIRIALAWRTAGDCSIIRRIASGKKNWVENWNLVGGSNFGQSCNQETSVGRFLQPDHDREHNYMSPDAYFFFSRYFWYLVCHFGGAKRILCALAGRSISIAIWMQYELAYVLLTEYRLLMVRYLALQV
jgi:hypothetical protein